jgi:hypothetical protein
MPNRALTKSPTPGGQREFSRCPAVLGPAHEQTVPIIQLAGGHPSSSDDVRQIYVFASKRRRSSSRASSGLVRPLRSDLTRSPCHAEWPAKGWSRRKGDMADRLRDPSSNIEHPRSIVLLIAARRRLTVCLVGFLQALLVALREFLACVGKPKKITCGSFRRDDMLVIKTVCGECDG